MSDQLAEATTNESLTTLMQVGAEPIQATNFELSPLMVVLLAGDDWPDLWES